MDLAIAMGVSPSTIYRWEKGKLPSMSELIRLAEVLERPLNYLAEPPEHQVELADLHRVVENLVARLESLEVQVVDSREAFLEILASNNVLLERILEQLDAQREQATL